MKGNQTRSTDDHVLYWECECGYLVTETQYFSARFDYPCPKCGTRLSLFHRQKDKNG